ncbi:MAG TPA: DUF1361 domain-containing protein [Gemmatimonadaceae bacterium]|nr:DUF1361 domain-containing protein [Gemmatimonadaceae bacterium]
MNLRALTRGHAPRLLLFVMLLGWCGALLVFRFARTGSLALAFLAWNLFLAAIPAVAAWFFARAMGRNSSMVQRVGWFVVWLVFLPNAPYIITDFVHLTPQPRIPLWYDIALFVSCAGTGLLLGYTSIADVQFVIARKFSALVGWLLVFAAVVLSGFGIYLGRFLRWNSWDTVTNPRQLSVEIADRVMNPLSNPQTVGVTVVYGVGLFLGYVALRFWQPATISGNERSVPGGDSG